MLGNQNQNKGIEYERDAREPEKKRKGSNLGAMPENSNKNKGIESGHDAGEPETKKIYRIRA